MENRGRKTKCGKRLMRTTLARYTPIAIRHSGDLNACRRIKAHHGAGRAIIATAGKLRTIIFHALKNGWVFDDFAAFKIQEEPIVYGQSS